MLFGLEISDASFLKVSYGNIQVWFHIPNCVILSRSFKSPSLRAYCTVGWKSMKSTHSIQRQKTSFPWAPEWVKEWAVRANEWTEEWMAQYSRRWFHMFSSQCAPDPTGCPLSFLFFSLFFFLVGCLPVKIYKCNCRSLFFEWVCPSVRWLGVHVVSPQIIRWIS